MASKTPTRPEKTTPGVLRVRRIPLTRLHPAPWNANVVSDAVLERVRNSIRRFGVVENLVARPLPNPCPICDGKDHLEVISGNHRLDIYAEEKLEKADCHVVELDDAQARVLAQTLNRTRGADDPEKYADLLRRVLEDLSVDEVTSFLPETEHSIDKLLGEATTPDADAAAAPPPTKPKSRRGQIYQLGAHRLMCGDATSQDDVDKLLDGAKPVLLVTDPPVQVDADLRVDWSEAWERVPSLKVAYIWHAGQYSDEVGNGLRRIGFDIAQQVIWDRGLFTPSRGHYQWQHEAGFYAARTGGQVPWYGPGHVPAFYARKRGVTAPWLGARDQSTVWSVPSPRMAVGSELGEDDEPQDHPTQKPVELYARPIKNHLRTGQALYDSFGGSGTAVIAAELTGRVAYVMEMDPAFCDVIRARYAAYTRQPDLAP